MSPPLGNDAFLKLAEALGLTKVDEQLRQYFRDQAQDSLESRGFFDQVINLASVTASGFPVDIEGYEVSFIRRASTPGALLLVEPGGMTKGPFAPGDKFSAHFTHLNFKLAANSVAAGTAVLRIGLSPQAHFNEFQGDDINISPVPLLGTLSPTGAVVGVAELVDVVPAGNQAGSFNIGGWSTILVFCDAGGAGVATTFTLTPWYQLGGSTSNIWWEEGTQKVNVPDTSVSGGQYRVVPFALTKTQGKLYLAINNPAGGLTGLTLTVLGVN